VAVHRLAPPTAGPTLAQGVAGYLDRLVGPESAGTRRVYAGTLTALAAHLGPETPLTALDEPATTERITTWFTSRWGQRAPATFNRNLDALRSAAAYWRDQDWITTEPSHGLRRRHRAPDRTRALPLAQIEALLTQPNLGLREKTLWRLLYETAARTGEVLALDIADLDLRNRRAQVRRKGGAADVIVWQTGTARLLPRLLAGRGAGPVFLTTRVARLPLSPADLDPDNARARLSYRRAAEVFTHATANLHGGPWTLHQLRHSALTHAAEAGANTPTLLSYSGHTSVRSLAKYTRVSPDALARWQNDRDPARHR
jgi:integrase/recombinase XerC/integrase/recombinase XerD